MSDRLRGAALTFTPPGHYLDAAYTHPMSLEAAAAIGAYTRSRCGEVQAGAPTSTDYRNAALDAFARMHGCDASSLALIPSTMAGENLVVGGLGITPGAGRIVTDGYHFNGSLFMYHELRQCGVDVHLVRPRGHRIVLEDYEAALKAGAQASARSSGPTLIAVSAVSATSGFVHDLKALCDLAHSHDALVYADLVQGAGAMPIDIRATGVDFCACSTYKWLLGDFGIAFFYARPESAARLSRRQIGYRQMTGFRTHFLPFDEPADGSLTDDAWPLVAQSHPEPIGRIEVGTQAHAAIVALGTSLPFLEAYGLDRLQAHRAPMFARLAEVLPSLGFTPMTDPDTPGPIVAYACRDALRFREALKARGVRISLYPNRIRISPSVYNTMDDIEALIEALQ